MRYNQSIDALTLTATLEDPVLLWGNPERLGSLARVTLLIKWEKPVAGTAMYQEKEENSRVWGFSFESGFPGGGKEHLLGPHHCYFP